MSATNSLSALGFAFGYLIQGLLGFVREAEARGAHETGEQKKKKGEILFALKIVFVILFYCIDFLSISFFVFLNFFFKIKEKITILLLKTKTNGYRHTQLRTCSPPKPRPTVLPEINKLYFEERKVTAKERGTHQ